ncbi:MAG: hypothetical protein AB7S26_39440 [Sandaracinaceae bacterium]
MSELARDFFGHNPAMAGPLVAMVLFTLVFAVAVIRAWRSERRHVQRMAHLALEGDAGEAKEVGHG